MQNIEENDEKFNKKTTGIKRNKHNASTKINEKEFDTQIMKRFCKKKKLSPLKKCSIFLERCDRAAGLAQQENVASSKYKQHLSKTELKTNVLKRCHIKLAAIPNKNITNGSEEQGFSEKDFAKNKDSALKGIIDNDKSDTTKHLIHPTPKWRTRSSMLKLKYLNSSLCLQELACDRYKNWTQDNKTILASSLTVKNNKQNIGKSSSSVFHWHVYLSLYSVLFAFIMFFLY